MWKPGDCRHSLLRRAESCGYPVLDFDTWYQQGMRCYQGALPKPLRKQAFRALVARWVAAGNETAMWHHRAFVYGALGLDMQGRRSRLVSDGYKWPVPPDVSWRLVVCAYPDGEVDLDFAHPVSRRFWSEDNGFLDLPEERTRCFNRAWYEQMGFEVMLMMPAAAMVLQVGQNHLRVLTKQSVKSSDEQYNRPPV